MNSKQYDPDDDITDEISSPYLKAADIPPAGMRLTIKICTLESFRNAPDEEKRVLLFYETKKRLICNKTQKTTLGELFGPHPSEWKSQAIWVAPAPARFNGKAVMTIEISAAQATVPSAKSHGIPQEAEPVSDTDMPF